MAEEYTASGKTIGEIREQSRRVLALRLLYIFAGVLIISIFIAAILIWFGKLNFDNGLTLILASTSTFSGLLGSAITFYFASDSNN